MIATRPERLNRDELATPVGPILVVTDEDEVLRALWFAGDREAGGAGEVDEAAEAGEAGEAAELDEERILRRLYGAVPLRPGPAPATIRQALERYFAGDLSALGTIRWGLAGTPFQRAVWTALSQVPVGTTTTYVALAARIGRPRAVRAVGAANGANPISLVVPCHRVIGSNGTLTGYGGGLSRKRWLLAHEGAILSLSDPII